MRFVTYVSLVLRRIWARKLMLLGSFLGATLVTALLVVLPLYEASVSAVDLLFTFRQAPEASVDLGAVHTTTEYSAAQAEAAREAVAAAASPISNWYPSIEERTISREFVVIPLGLAILGVPLVVPLALDSMPRAASISACCCCR